MGQWILWFEMIAQFIQMCMDNRTERKIELGLRRSLGRRRLRIREQLNLLDVVKAAEGLSGRAAVARCDEFLAAMRADKKMADKCITAVMGKASAMHAARHAA